MRELRTIKAESAHEVLLVADAMTGQDAVSVAEKFNQHVGIGVIVTKMDGDARGGAALSLRQVTGGRSSSSAWARSSTRWSRSTRTASLSASSAWATS